VVAEPERGATPPSRIFCVSGRGACHTWFFDQVGDQAHEAGQILCRQNIPLGISTHIKWVSGFVEILVWWCRRGPPAVRGRHTKACPRMRGAHVWVVTAGIEASRKG